MKKDYCTWFPERWPVWIGSFKWRLAYIGDCCKIHDDKCSTSKFFMCLKRKRAVGFKMIVTGGAIGCWIRHTKQMISRM